MRKRINKITVANKLNKKKWYVKLMFAFLLCIFIMSAASLIKFYFDVNKDNVGNSYPGNNIIADLDTKKNNYRIFVSDDGMFGVKDSEDRYIIEPKWNNISFLNSERFAVQQKYDDKLKIGVIDCDENCISPFIFDNIVSIGKDFLAGYLSDEDGFALLDTSGNIISEKVWTSFEYNKTTSTVILSSDFGKYSYKYDNGILNCLSLEFSKNIENYTVNYHSNNFNLIKSISPEKIYSIYDTACIYLGFLISGDMNDISSITNEQYEDSLAVNDFFENCRIKKIDKLNIDFTKNDTEAYTLSAEIAYEYKDEDKTIENLKSLISLLFVKDEKNSIILKSINKEEL